MPKPRHWQFVIAQAPRANSLNIRQRGLSNRGRQRCGHASTTREDRTDCIRVMQRGACCLTQSALHPALECFRMSTEIISADGPVAINGLPAQRRGWAAAAIFTALAMASLDTAIANIALPAIAADLHASPSEVISVVNVYQIAMVATLLRIPPILVCLFPQQPVMHAGFLTSGLGSPTNMLRFGILIAASVLASSVASAGSRPSILRM
jgi:hypothetical protein